MTFLIPMSIFQLPNKIVPFNISINPSSLDEETQIKTTCKFKS